MMLRNSIRNLLLSLLLLSAIGASIWSILVSNESHSTQTNDSSSLPDAFMEEVVATFMNKQGDPALKVLSPKMTHYTNHDITNIEKPLVTIYRNSPNPWYINSDYAKTSQGLGQIDFWSHVKIYHQADNKNPLTTMKTMSLTVFPDKQTAETNQAIVIQQPSTIIHAVGMSVDMNDGTVKLLSQARGEYDPNS